MIYFMIAHAALGTMSLIYIVYAVTSMMCQVTDERSTVDETHTYIHRVIEHGYKVERLERIMELDPRLQEYKRYETHVRQDLAYALVNDLLEFVDIKRDDYDPYQYHNRLIAGIDIAVRTS